MKRNNPGCLHCVLMDALEDWAEVHARKEAGQTVYDIPLIVAKFTECIVELTESVVGRSGRRRAFRYAHDALDANLKAHQTGKLVELKIEAEH